MSVGAGNVTSDQGIRVAATVDHRVVGLQIGKRQGLDEHAGIVELRVEARDLDGLLNVPAGGAVVVVVDVTLRLTDGRAAAGAAFAAGDRTYQRVRTAADVLCRMHVEVGQHAHLHVLGGLDVAVIHVGARLHDVVVVGQGRAHVDGDGHLRHAVEHRGGVGKAVPVDGVRVEQVRPDHRADVGQRQVELVALLQFDGGPRPPGIQDAFGDDVFRRGAGLVTEAEGIHRVAVGHVDEAVAGDQVHALGVDRRPVPAAGWVVFVLPGRRIPGSVAVIVPRALDVHHGVSPLPPHPGAPARLPCSERFSSVCSLDVLLFHGDVPVTCYAPGLFIEPRRRRCRNHRPGDAGRHRCRQPRRIGRITGIDRRARPDVVVEQVPR